VGALTSSNLLLIRRLGLSGCAADYGPSQLGNFGKSESATRRRVLAHLRSSTINHDIVQVASSRFDQIAYVIINGKLCRIFWYVLMLLVHTEGYSIDGESSNRLIVIYAQGFNHQ
jgi:hypothetical protein